jgi:two-component system copper resistance phosphate regulon response regulator CusR
VGPDFGNDENVTQTRASAVKFPQSPSNALKVLLIEDEARIASIVCSGLGERGWQVDHYDDGQQGIERALAHSYNAIVLDLMLPGRDGLDVLKTLRAQILEHV